jgi:hypothetical protein
MMIIAKSVLAKSILALALVAVVLFPTSDAKVTQYCQRNQNGEGGPFWHEMYGRTTDDTGTYEVAPTWDDCNQFAEFMKQAGCSPTEWFCELRWGWCGVAGWGSCVHANFKASAVCATVSDFKFAFGVSPAGPNAGLGAGFHQLHEVFNVAWGTATGC